MIEFGKVDCILFFFASRARNCRGRSGIRSHLGQRQVHAQTLEYGDQQSRSRLPFVDAPSSVRAQPVCSVAPELRTRHDAHLGSTSNLELHGETVRSCSRTRQERQTRRQCPSTAIAHGYVASHVSSDKTSSRLDLVDEAVVSNATSTSAIRYEAARACISRYRVRSELSRRSIHVRS